MRRGWRAPTKYLCGESQIEDVLIVADRQFIILCNATHGMQRILGPETSEVSVNLRCVHILDPYSGIRTWLPCKCRDLNPAKSKGCIAYYTLHHAMREVTTFKGTEVPFSAKGKLKWGEAQLLSVMTFKRTTCAIQHVQIVLATIVQRCQAHKLS